MRRLGPTQARVLYELRDEARSTQQICDEWQDGPSITAVRRALRSLKDRALVSRDCGRSPSGARTHHLTVEGASVERDLWEQEEWS